MSDTDKVYLLHISQSISRILDYTQKATEVSFYRNQQLLDAVVRNFEIIGEATNRISNATKEKYPEIEWRKMAGTRDKLIHDYMEVDYSILWTTIIELLPDLKAQVEQIDLN